METGLKSSTPLTFSPSLKIIYVDWRVSPKRII